MLEEIGGGVTAAAGFRAAGVEAGIKAPGRPDVALLAADRPAAAAALYTTNRVAAAPVRLDRERTRSGRAQAVLVNSGCANACTGEGGMRDAEASAALVAEALGIDPSLALVCSTGVIGTRLPMGRLGAGIRKAAAALSREGGGDAARAILTTDTVDKQFAVRLDIGGAEVRIGGMCKGSGMIEPNMATMLAFLTTDADVGAEALDAALRAAADASFNKIVVDGDRSTNDTVIALASGAAGGGALGPGHPQWGDFTGALARVCGELARKMVMDGEGATKFVTVRVRGARSDADAAKVARAVAKSPLVKTSWFGLDPNWGRVIAAAGYSGAEVDERAAQIFYDGQWAYDRGRVPDAARLEALRGVMRKRAFDVTVDLHLGAGEETLYTCDLSHGYVTINAEYTT